MIRALDGWLWRRGLEHPVIRNVVRNEILLAAVFLIAGALAFRLTSWLFWFGAGATVMAWTFWGLARFFLRRPLGDFSSAFMRVVIMRWLGRLLVTAAFLYAALIVCAAPVLAIAGGLVCASLCALVSYAAAAHCQR